MIDVQQYLQRIGYQEDLAPSLNLLTQLQRHHLLAIPFENLAIHQNEEIRLEVDRIFQKVIHHRRGGFCYELNGIFHFLLAELGFKVKRISASVYSREGIPGPEYDHLVNMVFLDQTWWLTDVGFGDFPLKPVPLVNKTEVSDRYERFWLEEVGPKWILKKEDHAGEQIDKYELTPIEREFDAFAPMCHYHQTSPDSPFPNKKLCTIATLEGRITLGGDKLIITKGRERTETPIDEMNEFAQYLWEYFQIQFGNQLSSR